MSRKADTCSRPFGEIRYQPAEERKSFLVRQHNPFPSPEPMIVPLSATCSEPGIYQDARLVLIAGSVSIVHSASPTTRTMKRQLLSIAAGMKKVRCSHDTTASKNEKQSIRPQTAPSYSGAEYPSLTTASHPASRPKL